MEEDHEETLRCLFTLNSNMLNSEEQSKVVGVLLVCVSVFF
jgi:hypothetical protein